MYSNLYVKSVLCGLNKIFKRFFLFHFSVLVSFEFESILSQKNGTFKAFLKNDVSALFRKFVVMIKKFLGKKSTTERSRNEGMPNLLF